MIFSPHTHKISNTCKYTIINTRRSKNTYEKKETGQGNLLKGIEDESAKQEASADMKLKNLPNY